MSTESPWDLIGSRATPLSSEDRSRIRLEQWLPETIRTTLKPFSHVLVIACGNGGGACQLAGAGHRVTALDRSRVQLQRTAELAKTMGFDVDRVLAPASSLPFASICFDAVLIENGVLSFLESRPEVFQEIARVLRPGGRFVLHDWHPVLPAFDPDGDVSYGGPSQERRLSLQNPLFPEVSPQSVTYLESAPSLTQLFQELLSTGLRLVDFNEFPEGEGPYQHPGFPGSMMMTWGSPPL